MSASLVWPCACRLAIASAELSPAGNCMPTTPAYSTLVALPRILGPATENATLMIDITITAMILNRSGLSVPSSLSAESLKSLAFGAGAPRMPPPGPNPGPPPLFARSGVLVSLASVTRSPPC